MKEHACDGVMDFLSFVTFLDHFELMERIGEIEENYRDLKMSQVWFGLGCLTCCKPFMGSIESTLLSELYPHKA